MNSISRSAQFVINFSKASKGLLVVGCALAAISGYAFLRPQPTPVLKHRFFIQWAGLGEYELSFRIVKACKKLGWNATLCYGGEQFIHGESDVLPDSLISHSVSDLLEQSNPDFILNFKENKVLSSKVPNYLVVFGENRDHFDPEKDLSSLSKFDGILHPSPSVDLVEKQFEKTGKPFHSARWYPSCLKTEYQPTKPNQIFFCGFQWDRKRNGAEYRKLFSLLDQANCLTVYGPLEKWDFIPNSAQGLLPFDGVSIEKAIRKAGISLVLHTDAHIKYGAPTSRIFEAAAACAITICDDHPFVKQEFGDTVLYIDGTKDGEELFRQVHDHYQWILAHPKEAEEMARRFHAIFAEKFTLEGQMLELSKMHTEVLRTRS